jgi:hypothetical protein
VDFFLLNTARGVVHKDSKMLIPVEHIDDSILNEHYGEVDVQDNRFVLAKEDLHKDFFAEVVEGKLL